MKHTTIIAIVLVVAFAGGIWAALHIAPPGTDNGSVQPQYFQAYPAARELPDFTLTRADSTALTKSDLKQQWTLVFLGYTHCPDICPTTLAALNQIYPQLQKIESELPIKVMFLSVDPKRDTPARLASYKAYFNPEFIAATAGHGEIFPLVRSFGLVYAISESTQNADYLVDHSGSIVLIGPDATARGRFKTQSSLGKLSIANPDHIVADLPKIIQVM